jgi:hypothetical protein
MPFERRVERLEQAVGANTPRCAQCGGAFVARVRDGEPVPTCPACGMVPVVVVRRVPARCPDER